MTAEYPKKHPTKGKPTLQHIYRNQDGEIIAVTNRFDLKKGKKMFLPYNPQTKEWKAPSPRPLYNLDKIYNSDEPIILVEGEKCADALMSLDILATTAFGGANAIHVNDLTPLKGKQVIIWPDADRAGQQYSDDACAELERIGAKEIHILPIEDMPPKWDAANAVYDNKWTISRIQELLERKIPYTYRIRGNDETPRIRIRKNTQPRIQGNTLAETTHNWGEPDRSILNTAPKPPKFPLEIFSPFWQRWIRQKAEGACAPIDYVAGTLLATTSSLIGNARRVSPWEGWIENTVLWIALIGSPSSNKSPAMDPVVDIIRELERDALPAYEEQLAAHETTLQTSKVKREGWLEEVRTAEKLGNPPPQIPKTAQEPDKPIRPRIRVADSTPEALANILAQQPKGILMQRDELAGWIKSFDRYSKGGEKQFWLEAYGGRPYTVDRVKLDSQPIEIPFFSIAVLGSTQPDPLENLLLSGDDDGFSARFLYFWPEKLPAKRPHPHPTGPGAYICLKRLHDLALETTEENNMIPLIRRLTESATDIFEPWWTNHQDNEPEGRFCGWWGKVPGMTLRLSLILEYLEWSSLVGKDEPPHISEQAIINAITLSEDYLKPMARRAYGNVALSQDEKYAAIVARWIMDNKPDRINARIVQRTIGKASLPKPDNMRDACGLLIDANWLFPDFNRDGSHKGREKIEYLVNPHLLNPAQ